MRIPPLLLSENWKIDDAVQASLNRQKDLIYEPIIVVMENQSFRLLDVHTLLMAQSKLLAQANKIIEKYRVERHKNQALMLQQEQAKVQECNELLKSQQRHTEKSQNTPSLQEVALVKQAEEIAQMNERFLRIAKLISSEGRLAFQATFQGANSICNNTERILGVGKAIANDLETVNRTSRTIRRSDRTSQAFSSTGGCSYQSNGKSAQRAESSESGNCADWRVKLLNWGLKWSKLPAGLNFAFTN